MLYKLDSKMLDSSLLNITARDSIKTSLQAIEAFKRH